MKLFARSIIYFIAIAFLISCNETRQNSNSATVANFLPKEFYMKLKGSIGEQYPITMDLFKSDTYLNGSYYYNKVGKPIDLRGKVLPSGAFTLTETNEDGKSTGLFSGKFIDSVDAEGTWQNLQNNKKFTFRVSKTTQGCARISYQKLHKDNCNGKLKNAGDSCSSVDIDLLKVSLKDRAISDGINHSIIQELCRIDGDTVNSTDDILAMVPDKPDTLGFFYYDISSGMETNDNNILSVEFSSETYEYRAAHPSENYYFCNYDLQTGKKLTVDDLLKPNSWDALTQIAEKRFREENKEDRLDNLTFQLPPYFGIQKDGLIFIMSGYDLSMGRGTFTEIVPFKDIEQLIKPDGILAGYRKN